MGREKYTWDLGLLYKSDDDPQIEIDCEGTLREWNSFIKKWKKDKKYLEDPKALYIALKEFEHLYTVYGLADKPMYYFWLKQALKQDDPKIKAKLSKIEDFATKLGNDIQFFTNSIARIPTDSQKKFLKDKNLAVYNHFLERTFISGKYLLSDDEEKILNLMVKPAYANWTKMTEEFLSKEEREMITEKGKRQIEPFNQIVGSTNSTNKKIRDLAGKYLHEINAQFADVATEEINSILEYKKVLDDLRKIERPDVSRHISDDIDSEVVDSLIKSVSSRFDISQRYYKLKAKLLKLKKLKYHERNVPIGELKTEFKFDESKKLVLRTFEKLDSELFHLAKLFFDRRLVDVNPKKGKIGGAFCIGYKTTLPTYILLNHNDKISDVTTIAHEFGHGINNELMKKSLSEINYGAPTSTAEVASTFFEDFIINEISLTLSDKERLILKLEKLNGDISSIFRQVALYKFEQELHKQYREKGYLSKIEIGNLFSKHMFAYMGSSVSKDKGSENWWVYWSHIRNFFYVYSYASGLLISKSLQNFVKRDPTFIQSVKSFLSEGQRRSPKDIFKTMGIDITDKAFWNKGLDQIEALLNEVESLAKKLGKI
ncbi:MAG: PepF/M3 family oligoendopeptidase [candidate division WS6 bacterium GW2011_GWF2_39_15]|uniref:PepF/M3 family oligoendopeptidase n=1 Tax=candidate division WS6 bacterium GW2011_GWF2_39_15 TaxID=1619100 RepID=A0A0G0MS32_9BACT|nr:MAG: PepF/M3 family oligoendopeptidase [candidate division WS6 bacterium GW2011_GWF2_39_15]